MEEKSTTPNPSTIFKKPSLNQSPTGSPTHASTNIMAAIEQDINKNRDQIMGVIEDLNGRLMDMFRKKQQQLLDEYKKEMFRAKSELNELRENTNEQELRKRMIEKKQQLQREREQFLQASIFFSNKCETFKAKLTRVVNETRDLENEIKFLNQQIENANKKNLKLKQEINSVQEKRAEQTYPGSGLMLISSGQKDTSRSMFSTNLKSRRQPNSSTIKKDQSIRSINDKIGPQIDSSQKRANISINQNQSRNLTEAKKLKERNNKIRELLKDPVFQETKFESLFLESVEKVKSRKRLQKEKTISTTLPTLRREQPKENKELELNEFDKRQIMEDFLSKEEVKKCLYNIIFKETGDKNSGLQIKADIFEKNFDDGPV